jgi:hypothetical protein
LSGQRSECHPDPSRGSFIAFLLEVVTAPAFPYPVLGPLSVVALAGTVADPHPPSAGAAALLIGTAAAQVIVRHHREIATQLMIAAIQGRTIACGKLFAYIST